MRALVQIGKPYEMGVAHGRAFHDLTAAAMHNVVAERAIPADVQARVAAQVESNLQAVFPEALEELHGIAEGAGLPFEQVLAYNACQELWRYRPALPHQTSPGRAGPGCTNVALVTAEHGVLHYKSDDVEPEQRPFHVFLEIRPPRGHDLIGVTWAGTTWMNAGVNSAGLTYGGGSINNADVDWERGVPGSIVLRYLLQYAGDVDAGIDLLRRVPIMAHGLNLMLTDAAGNAAVVERSPTRMAVRRLADHALWCTNHYLDEATRPTLRTDDPAFDANSHERFDLLARLTTERPHTLAQLQAISRTHAEPVSICQHGPVMHSTMGYILVGRERRMLVSEGYPCETEFVEHTFASSLSERKS